jgi:broad specificity polyphosphatase/5'/3'-nucleotidase SurE
MNAESNAPKLARVSPRPEALPWSTDGASVAPGDSVGLGVQQSGAGVSGDSVSSGMNITPNIGDSNTSDLN